MPGTPNDVWLLPQQPGVTADELSPTADEVAKQAIQDVARHEEQIVKLILFHDDRALRILSVYVPVIGVLMAGTIALYQAAKLTVYLGVMIGGTAASLLVGCIYAFSVLWKAQIYLPSRKPVFWQWALKHDVELRAVASAYVDQSIKIVAENERHSSRASDNLTRSYICGIGAPFVGAALVWVYYWSQR